jgi:hypothetical protein
VLDKLPLGVGEGLYVMHHDAFRSLQAVQTREDRNPMRAEKIMSMPGEHVLL